MPNFEASERFSMSDPIIIASYARTPIGSFQGSLARFKATELGAAAAKAAVERAGLAAEDINQVIMGCVLPAALGQAPARQVALGAELPLSVQATTVNKMCGSGMQAAILAHDAIAVGSADVVVAGGMESMTNAPYALPKHRGGARIGHDRIVDTMMMDGLEDAYASARPWVPLRKMPRANFTSAAVLRTRTHCGPWTEPRPQFHAEHSLTR